MLNLSKPRHPLFLCSTLHLSTQGKSGQLLLWGALKFSKSQESSQWVIPQRVFGMIASWASKGSPSDGLAYPFCISLKIAFESPRPKPPDRLESLCGTTHRQPLELHPEDVSRPSGLSSRTPWKSLRTRPWVPPIIYKYLPLLWQMDPFGIIWTRLFLSLKPIQKLPPLRDTGTLTCCIHHTLNITLHTFGHISQTAVWLRHQRAHVGASPTCLFDVLYAHRLR